MASRPLEPVKNFALGASRLPRLTVQPPPACRLPFAVRHQPGPAFERLDGKEQASALRLFDYAHSQPSLPGECLSLLIRQSTEVFPPIPVYLDRSRSRLDGIKGGSFLFSSGGVERRLLLGAEQGPSTMLLTTGHTLPACCLPPSGTQARSGRCPSSPETRPESPYRPGNGQIFQLERQRPSRHFGPKNFSRGV